MRVVAILAAALLAGCGTARIENASTGGGAVSFAAPATLSQALALAESHCARQGRAAVPTSVVDRLALFDCR